MVKINNLRSINNLNNFTEEEIYRKNHCWTGYILFAHHFFRLQRTITQIRVEERRNAPVIIISDDLSSSSSDSNSSAGRASPVPIVEQANNVIELPMHSVARAWNALSHLL